MSYIQDSINPTRGLQKRICPKCDREIHFFIRQTWIEHVQNCQGKKAVLSKQDIACHFCGGILGAIEKQEHPNPNFAEFRTCLTCGYQWAKEYWKWLAKEQGIILRISLTWTEADKARWRSLTKEKKALLLKHCLDKKVTLHEAMQEMSF